MAGLSQATPVSTWTIYFLARAAIILTRTALIFPRDRSSTWNGSNSCTMQTKRWARPVSPPRKGCGKDSQAASPSLAGSAYQVILDASKRSRPDFAEDPALDQSKQTYEKIDDIAKWFGDCKTDTEYQKRERLTHIPEYHHCTRLYKPAGGCTIQHTIE